MLQLWSNQMTSDAIGRAVDSGADLWTTRQAGAIGNFGAGGWGGMRGGRWSGKH
jgi:hypothetical protein